MSLTEILWMLAPAGGTLAGGLAILAVRARPAAAMDALLGFTAGVMLAASAFSLLVPALDEGSLWEVLVGFAVGGACLAALDMWLPHAHARFLERGHAEPR